MPPYSVLRFAADAEDAERWADALLAAGALSVDVSDPHAGTPAEAPLYGEPGVQAGRFWSANCLAVLFPTGFDPYVALVAVASELHLEVPPHEVSTLDEQDWVRATQAQFAPIRIGDRLWVVPSWCDAVDPHAVNLILDPGLAFGTGSHPTTRLCLAWLESELPSGASVLDYGCGSGILAIAAAKLGAAEVFGTDIDPLAIGASRDNSSRNGVSATFVTPDDLARCAPAKFDLVIANILANPLLLLAPALAARVRPEGRIVLSGILEPQADTVCASYARWFTMTVWRSEEGWLALAGVRRSGAT
jgi:ribosomal protein L11 methyltransferase